MKVKANVPGPWGKRGVEFEMDDADESLQWHLSHGALVEADGDTSDDEPIDSPEAEERAAKKTTRKRAAKKVDDGDGDSTS